jgi:hypothetical protein
MVRAARIFVADSAEPAKPAIIAALYRTPDGVWTEQQSPEVLVDWREPEKLAAAVRRAIERFALKDVDLRHGKLTDRPSFRASGFRTVRSFESTYNSIWFESKPSCSTTPPWSPGTSPTLFCTSRSTEVRWTRKWAESF